MADVAALFFVGLDSTSLVLPVAIQQVVIVVQYALLPVRREASPSVGVVDK